jgi:hypothetical protein
MSDFFGGGAAVSGIAQAGAMIAVAALQYETWSKQIERADAIARRIQDRADESHRIWKDFYLPKELATVEELDQVPLRTANLGAVRQRAEAQYRGMLDRAKADALLCLDSQCVGARCDISREMELRAAGLAAYGVEAALRAEETRVDLQNRQRVADKLTILAHGRQVHHNSAAALGTAVAASQMAAQQSAGAFNGAVSALGALARRREQAAGRTSLAPVETRDITLGNPMAMTDPRIDENGYGTFPQPQSGDAGQTAYFQPPDYSVPGFQASPADPSTAPTTRAPGTQDFAGDS